MRWLFLFVLVVLAGCAGKVTPPEPERPDRVTPVALNVMSGFLYDAESSYARPLLENLGQSGVYTLLNGQRLKRNYFFVDEVLSSSDTKTVLSMKDRQGNWGYITTSISKRGVANAFLVEHKAVGTAYALVLKRARICLATNANGAPYWQSGKWRFSSKPGYLECTGLTNSSIYRVGSGMPGLLNPYYEDGDTVLLFRSFGQLQLIVNALKEQFPHLKLPKIY